MSPGPHPVPGPAGTPDAPASSRHGQGPVLAAVSVGGAVGAVARYAAGLWWPTPAGTFPWTTFVVNVVGCAAIGVLMVLVLEVRKPHPLWRPFLGTGVLGGFTTFSTYAVDIQRLVDRGRAAVAVAYLGATLLAAMAAVWAATTLTRRLHPMPAPQAAEAGP
ncbi:fluoride efflux transporter CrcB [Yinghuangia seranimata]|uniref:fluoride efflux transporter CrcB n=1 Tax=Yinghuangia seranimata TaxID=408067 RepID=UPI00248CC710|nr:fluoride efflux transporter CrcB [Yinghuangia seranimata]MDI2130742.1 fluoride efflux transporter CrcB [Yinghuangia seranimata]